MRRVRNEDGDLDAMRKDMEALGEALDAAAKGTRAGAQARKPGPKRAAAKETAAGATRRPRAGLRPLSVLLAMALALGGTARAADGIRAAPTHRDSAASGKADSLHALRILLTSETKSGGEALILKDPRLSDSLLRHPAPRETFLKGLREGGLARPINGPEEFRAYWDRLEKENGIKALRNQMDAHDIDKGRIPKAYLFDSSVVVYPGWIIVRKAR